MWSDRIKNMHNLEAMMQEKLFMFKTLYDTTYYGSKSNNLPPWMTAMSTSFYPQKHSDLHMMGI